MPGGVIGAIADRIRRSRRRYRRTGGVVVPCTMRRCWWVVILAAAVVAVAGCATGTTVSSPGTPVHRDARHACHAGPGDGCRIRASDREPRGQRCHGGGARVVRRPADRPDGHGVAHDRGRRRRPPEAHERGLRWRPAAAPGAGRHRQDRQAGRLPPHRRRPELDRRRRRRSGHGLEPPDRPPRRRHQRCGSHHPGRRRRLAGRHHQRHRELRRREPAECHRRRHRGRGRQSGGPRQHPPERHGRRGRLHPVHRQPPGHSEDPRGRFGRHRADCRPRARHARCAGPGQTTARVRVLMRRSPPAGDVIRRSLHRRVDRAPGRRDQRGVRRRLRHVRGLEGGELRRSTGTTSSPSMSSCSSTVFSGRPAWSIRNSWRW